MDPTESTVRGRLPLSRTRPPRDHGVGRVCVTPGCTTRLARYNAGVVCYRHATPQFSRIGEWAR
jgi:hypothetical protein